jgi:hypothetical protein
VSDPALLHLFSPSKTRTKILTFAQFAVPSMDEYMRDIIASELYIKQYMARIRVMCKIDLELAVGFSKLIGHTMSQMESKTTLRFESSIFIVTSSNPKYSTCGIEYWDQENFPSYWPFFLIFFPAFR